MRSTFRKALGLTMSAAAAVTVFTAMAPANASPSEGTDVGYQIPYANGAPGSFIGNYTADGVQSYCADAEKSGPITSNGYSALHNVSSWKYLNGHAVPIRSIRRAAWIVSTAGKTTNPIQAAAVDTDVYALLDAGTYAWGGARSTQRMQQTGHYDAVHALAKKLLDDSLKYAGTYKLNVSATDGTYEGSPITVTARVISDYGTAMPGIHVKISDPLAAHDVTVTTNSSGVATYTFTPTKVGSATVAATAVNLPGSDLPVKYPNNTSAQRMLVAGVHQDISGKTPKVQAVLRYTPTVTTKANAQTARILSDLYDNVQVTMRPGTPPITVTTKLWGPATEPNKLVCSGTPLGTVTFTVTTTGTYPSPKIPARAAGYVGWQESLSATSVSNAVTTPCNAAGESTLVTKYTPVVTTTANASDTTVKAPMHDNVKISGIPAGAPAIKVTAYLSGPATKRGTLTCSKAIRTVTFTATGNGSYKTPNVTVNQPGYYSWHEVLDATSDTNAVSTDCRTTVETTLVHRPGYRLQIIPTGPDGYSATPQAPFNPEAPLVALLAIGVLAGTAATRRHFTKNGN